MKVLVIGLDGACMDLIKVWTREGKLPTFEKLMREGSYGNLESVTPPLTIPAWNCLATGKNPGKLGCFGFVQKVYKSYDFRLCASLSKKEKDIWDILSGYGRKVFVLNAPNVISAHKINGYMVAGFLCLSEKNLAYPEGLRDLLRDMNYKRGSPYIIPFLTGSDYEISRMLEEMTESICKVLFHFLEKEWDFGFVVFQELDGAGHRFWNRKDILLKHYQHIDRKLKEILNKLNDVDDETNIIIVSDHGFGPNKRVFLINEWLAREGYLKLRKKPSLLLINTIIRVLKEENILRILKLLMKCFPHLLPLYESLFRGAMRVPILWNETKAFCYGNWGMIYINLSGREPQGIVKEENYEELRTEIIEKLQKISVKACRREEIYHGPYLELAPDIIIQIDDYVNSVAGKIGYNKEFTEGFIFEGYHNRMNGTFIAWGPDIRENFEINAKIYDIAPTILHMFGVPIPKDMDGRVLKEIFKGDLAMQEIKYQELEENRRIKKRIKELKRSGRI